MDNTGSIDRTFCEGYIDYLTTEYRPTGKRLSNFTLRNYYRVLNSALNAAVRVKLIVVNPFNELERSEKITCQRASDRI